MALRGEEILQIKYQLGVSLTSLGAEPYITYLAIFDRVIQPFIFDPATTSATYVGAGIGSIAITVAAIPNLVNTTTPAFMQGTSLIVDVGPAQETTQIIVVTGLQIWVNLQNEHGKNGAYPVFMAGSEAIIRNILKRIQIIESQLGSIAVTTAGLEKAEDASFYGSSTGGSRRGTRDKFETLIMQREQARDDLGEAVGFPNLRRLKQQAGSRVSPY